MSKKTMSIAISIPLFVAFTIFMGVLILQNMRKDTQAKAPRALQQQESKLLTPTIHTQKTQQKDIEDLHTILNETIDAGSEKQLDALTKDIEALE